MHVERKRIFVGNLPPYVQEDEIKKQFSQFGNVVSVDIKHKKETVNEDVSSVFAFVSIEIDNKNLQTCFKKMSNYDWQGYYVKLELAKESFLERLKREREEAQTEKLNNSTTKETASISLVNNVSKNDSKTSTTITYVSSESDSSDESAINTNNNIKSNVIKQPSSSSSSSSDSESSSDESETKKKLQQKSKTEIDNIPDMVIKNNKNNVSLNGKLKIETINSTPIHIIEKKKNNFEKSKNLTIADEKRLNSLDQMKRSYQNQKSAIKNALAKIDVKPKNKIIFDDNDLPKKRKTSDNNHESNEKEKKLRLFDDDAEEEDNNINFEIKKQFEGKQGEKLLALQSRYTNDKRFTMDSIFFEEDELVEDNEIENLDDDDEKQKQLDILESVLGKKINRQTKSDTTKLATKQMLRFDPTKPEHLKFEIKERESRGKQKEVKQKKKKTVEESVPVEVSKEKFYKVKENLQDSLKEKSDFRLLSMFGKAEEETNDNENEAEENEKIFKTKQFGDEKNPFRYDSSDSENEEDLKESDSKRNEPKYLPSIFRREKFFFQENDVRLKEGLEFLEKISSEEKPQPFSETRRELKGLVKWKVRQVQRKNRPFQKKIGKNKMIKIKKALRK